MSIVASACVYQTSDLHTKVYSPHTAVDAAEGGLGDWLADIASGDVDVNVASQQTASPATANLTNEGPQYALHDFSKTMAQGDTGFRP